jgi:hypothetical protein
MAVRAAGLAALAWWELRRGTDLAGPLVAYVFGVLAFLMLEYRRMIRDWMKG